MTAERFYDDVNAALDRLLDLGCAPEQTVTVALLEQVRDAFEPIFAAAVADLGEQTPVIRRRSRGGRS